MKSPPASAPSPAFHRFQINRRRFLKSAAMAGVPLWFLDYQMAVAASSPARRPGPNDRPGIALIGCGGMGRGDAKNASRFGDLIAVCDVDDNHAEAAAQQFAKDGKTPRKYRDFRQVMERDEINVIVQATPDHWHTLINLAAARAGKDIYAEKPLTHSIDEGRHLVEAVRKNKVVLQTGTQQRSDRKFRLACELVRSGRIGKLKQVSVFVPAGISGGPFAPKPVPPELNWDFWLGQSPNVEYLPKRCHANFRWWFDYAGGPVTDWGAHHNDIARWAIGQDGPVAIEARALKDPIPGGYTTPPEFGAHLTWPNEVHQVVRTTVDDTPYGGIVNPQGQRNGLKFEGTNGWIWVNRADLQASDESLLETPLPESAVLLPVSNDHMGNFFDGVRNRKDPIATVEAGHRSASVGHLIVIALRTGLKLNFDPGSEKFVGDNAQPANAHLARPQRKPYDYAMVS